MGQAPVRVSVSKSASIQFGTNITRGNPVPEPATVDAPRELAPVAPKPVSEPSRAGDATESTPRAKMKTLNVEVPDYAWIAIKMRAAQEMSSVRHVIMTALKAQGIEIRDADMIEDGRRLRGDSN